MFATEVFSVRRISLSSAGWVLWAALGYPALVVVTSILALGFAPLGLGDEGPGGYWLAATLSLVVFVALGRLAAKQGIPRGLQYLGIAWASMILLVALAVMSSFGPADDPIVSALLQSLPAISAGFGWWLTTRRSASSAGDRDTGPSRATWIVAISVASLAILGLLVYYYSGG